jgi:hypothetical protein
VKVLHVISGGETGGSRKHVVTLLSKFAPNTATLAVFQDGPLANEARALGVDVRLLSQSSRYDLSVLSKLVALVRAEKFDLLHTHGPRANLYGALIKRNIRIPWVTTIHSDPRLDFMKTGIKGALFTRLNLWALRKVDYFFAVSERFKESLIELGMAADRIQTVYNGIDFDDIPRPHTLRRADLGLRDEELVIAMVARLHPVKGHAIVFSALAALSDPDIQLLVIGDGPLAGELQDTAAQTGIGRHVQFLGFRSDVADLYALSDVALLASYSESFPLALLEAANARLPVISTDVGGVKQLIASENMGWVVPVGDSAALARAIRDAKQRKHELKAMGERLYNHASTHFSLQRLYEETMATYERVLAIDRTRDKGV